MKKLVLALFAVAALVSTTAAAASACHGQHLSARHDAGDMHFKTVAFASKHHFFRHGLGAFEKLAGTGTSLSDGTATASGNAVGNKLHDGTYTAAISTDWSKATQNRFGGSCAPATGTFTFTGSDTANTATESVDGVTCTVGSNPFDVAAVFFGKGTITNATGKAAGLVGKDGKVLLAEKSDGTVKGFAYAGFHGDHARHLAAFSKGDAHHCDGDGWHRDSWHRA